MFQSTEGTRIHVLGNISFLPARQDTKVDTSSQPLCDFVLLLELATPTLHSLIMKVRVKLLMNTTTTAVLKIGNDERRQR
jgi:hypothetical protein